MKLPRLLKTDVPLIHAKLDNMEEQEFATGGRLEAPDERDFKYELLIGGADTEVLPASFEIPLNFWFNQKKIDACAGHSFAALKSNQEGVVVSPRVVWGLAKKKTDYIGYGSSFQECFAGNKEIGSPEYGTIDESTDVDREKYMRFELTEELKEKSAPHKSQSYWVVKGWQNVKKALIKENNPLVAYCDWMTSYNYPVNGFLPLSNNVNAGGHLFIVRGWATDQTGREYAKFRNSWGKGWGKDGDFYVYADELDKYDIKAFFAAVDMPKEVAKIVNKYDGQLIKNAEKPDVYFVKAGKIIAIQNETMFNIGKSTVGKAPAWWGDWKDIVTIPEKIEKDFIIKFG